ncbi:MAG: molybdate ABC transporter substrate-binding protein [Burkholderiales bacterium]|nr:molybdate ABC transporter substrate-binding protein [Burkholderiales bacterium]
MRPPASCLRRILAVLKAAGLRALLCVLALGSGPVLADPVVFAAASLKEALDAASAAWAKQSGARASISYAASSALARQIDQGAPADVFVSADGTWTAWLEGRGRLRAGSVAPLLTNRLVLVAPAAGPGPVLRLAPGVPLASALGTDGRLAVGDVAAVPAGRYARAALESIGAWPSVSGRLAQSENVRVALTLVARGEAPLGIVYATDALAEPKVRVVDTFPEAAHPPIVYPIAIVAGTRSSRAQGYVDFLRSPAGLAVFAAHGFGPAPR